MTPHPLRFAILALAAATIFPAPIDAQFSVRPGTSSIQGLLGSRPIRFAEPITGGYVLTHEHPMAGMAFGGNYAYAGSTSNYRDGMPEWSYGTCSGCFANRCDHAEVKGIFLGSQFGPDMGDHGRTRGPLPDSFSHLRYSTEWIRDAARPGSAYGDTRMKLMVAYAVESEPLCHLLQSYNVGGGGAGGDGYECVPGDSFRSLRRQVNAIKDWAARVSFAEIALDAWDARRIIGEGKLAIVLGVEADYAFGAESSSVDPVARLERYHRLGVRTFYLAHKVNSRLAGADVYRPKDTDLGKLIRAQQAVQGCIHYDDTAGLPSFPLVDGRHHFCDNDRKCGVDHIKGRSIFDRCNESIEEISEVNLASYLSRGDDEFNGFAIYPRTPGFGSRSGTRMVSGVERNELGLSSAGEAVVRRAMELGMIITLDHVSSRARDDIHRIAVDDFDGHPLNAFHNHPNERMHGYEKGIDPNRKPWKELPWNSEYDFDFAEREMIRETGGIFGLRLLPMRSTPYSASGVTATCVATSTETAKVLASLIDEGLSVGYSLDYAGGVPGLISRTERGCGLALGVDHLQRDRDGQITEGMAHVGNMERFHAELEAIGLRERYLDVLRNDGTEDFLRMWGKSEGYLTVAMP